MCSLIDSNYNVSVIFTTDWQNLSSTCKIVKNIGIKCMYSLRSCLVSEESVRKGVKNAEKNNNKIPKVSVV